MNKQLKIDEEFKKLIPPLTDEEHKQLEENLKEEGCRDSLVVWNETIVDGHNRYEICVANNIPFGVKEVDFENRQEAIEWIIKNQFGRRNLPAYERAKLALRLEPIIKEKAKERQLSTLKQNVTDTQISAERTKTKRNESRDELAKIAGVSHDTIEKVKFIEREATEEQKQALSRGEKKVNTVYRELKPAKPKKEDKPIEKVKNSETKICVICGKEKTIEEFYSDHKDCKECERTRKKAGLTIQEAKELHNKFSDEKLNALYEEMKSPCPLNKDTDKSNYNPIIAEFEELLNDFNVKINKFLFMEEYFADAKETKNLIQTNINNLQKIIEFIKE